MNHSGHHMVYQGQGNRVPCSVLSRLGRGGWGTKETQDVLPLLPQERSSTASVAAVETEGAERESSDNKLLAFIISARCLELSLLTRS